MEGGGHEGRIKRKYPLGLACCELAPCIAHLAWQLARLAAWAGLCPARAVQCMQPDDDDARSMQPRTGTASVRRPLGKRKSLDVFPRPGPIHNRVSVRIC